MPFPFYPAGVIAATLLLGGAIAVFRVLLLALDRGAAELRGSIGASLVRGVRAWAEAGQQADPTAPRRIALEPANPAAAILEELTTRSDVSVEAVRRASG